MALRIDGEVIPDQAIDFELARLVKFYAQHMSADQIRGQMDALRKKAVEQAIGGKLLLRETRRLDLFVPPEEVEARFQQMVKKAGGPEAFAHILQKQGMTEAALRNSIEEGRRVDMLVERITSGIPEPTEQEAQEHFRQHVDEYEKPDRAQAMHIFIERRTGDDVERESARAKLVDLKRQHRGGADFSELAAAHSECPSGKQTGGSLGWFSRGMMVPEFDEAVFAMEVGTVGDMVESSLGYHLIYKIGHEKGGVVEFEDVRDKVLEFLRHSRRGEVLATYVADLRQKARIEEV